LQTEKKKRKKEGEEKGAWPVSAVFSSYDQRKKESGKGLSHLSRTERKKAKLKEVKMFGPEGAMKKDVE